jgi:hypothetical protein
MDRRREGDELTDDELSDLDQFEEDGKVRLKAANLLDPKAGKEWMLSKREESASLKVVEEPSHTPPEASPPSTNDDPDNEDEHDDLLDLQDAGEEVAEDRLQ